MEVGKGQYQYQESFPPTFRCDDIDDEDDDDDVHFVIALDDSGQDTDELDGCTSQQPLDLTKNVESVGSSPTEILTIDRRFEKGKEFNDATNESLVSNATQNIVNYRGADVSLQDSKESSLGLRMECTTDHEERRNIMSPTIESATEIPTIPNFLVSSPEIIRRLKTSLLDRSFIPQDGSSHCEKEAPVTKIASSIFTHDKTPAQTSRKLTFTPKDDCVCIMCHGWNASKFVPQISSESSPQRSDTQESPIICDSAVSTQRDTSIVNVPNVTKAPSSSVTTGRSNPDQIGIRPTNSLRSVLTSSKVSCSSNSSVDNVKTNLYSSQSPATVNIGDDGAHNTLLKDTKEISLRRRFNSILKQNGSYFLLLPQPSMISSKESNVKPSCLTFVKKMIPEINTKEGKILVITNDFMISNRPDLRIILARAKKLDMSIPGTVCIIMADDKSSTASASSSTEIFMQSSGNAHKSVGNIGNKREILSENQTSEQVNDALLKVIHSHLTNFQSPLTASTLKKTFNKSLVQRSVSKIPHSSENKSLLVAAPSVETHSTKLSTDNFSDKSVFLVSKSSSDTQQLKVATLPPPPPLVRCPTAISTPNITSATIPDSPHASTPFSACFRFGTPLVSQHISSTTQQMGISCTTQQMGISCTTQQMGINCTTQQMGISCTTQQMGINCTTQQMGISCTTAPVIVSPHVSYTTASTSLISTTIPLSMKDVTPTYKRSNSINVIEEPTEILVIPVVGKNLSRRKQNFNNSKNDDYEFMNSDSLYTFAAPLENSPIKSTGQSPHKKISLLTGEISMEKNFKLIGNKSVNSTTMSTVSEDSLMYSAAKTTISNKAPNVVKTVIDDHQLESVSEVGSSFPSVVKVNLSSCENFTCPLAVPTPSGKHLSTAPTSAGSSVIMHATKYSTSSKDNSTNSTVFQNSEATVSASCNKFVQLEPPAFNYSSLSNLHPSSTPSSEENNWADDQSILSTPLAYTQQVEGNASDLCNSIVKSTQCSVNISTQPTLASSFLIQNNSIISNISTTKSSSMVVPTTTYPLQKTNTTVPSTVFSTSESSLPSVSSSLSVPSSSSASSVSVNGLKLKIRLGDSKSHGEGTESKSGKDFSAMKTNDYSDQNISVEANPSVKRKESAEEMFQRFQEQAMQDVYNAQFGIGNLSRSLRPARSNISFVDKCFKNIPVHEVAERKKTISDEIGIKNKLAEENKKSCSANEIMSSMLKNDESKGLNKVNKKRHSSSDSRCDIPKKDPKLDINSFPKLRQDNSILIRKPIFTHNIMAGHKVFVKFNVFSNQQSGRSFLIPFFNLGGSREQFDVEDMNYIKKSVTETEKEEKLCARHLIYNSREGKKASFLRKENLSQISDLTDKSYKKCSYILEGFTREPVKNKTLPVQEEWKVDKKVSIEIDTADVDNNIVIDFEDSLANAVVSKANGLTNSVTFNTTKSPVDYKEMNRVANSQSNSSTSKTKVSTGFYDMSISQNENLCSDIEGNGKTSGLPNTHLDHLKINSTYGNETENSYSIPVPQNDIHVPLHKQVNYIHSPLKESANSGPVHGSFCNTQSSNFTPSILRTKISGPSQSNSSSVLTASACHVATKLSNERVPSRSVPNYTDQLKELFGSGNLQETVPNLNMSTCLETIHTNKGHHFHDSPENSQPFLPTPIKQEIVDDEYQQSYLPHLQRCNNSSVIEESNPTAECLADFKIKPEPTDEFFDSLQRNRVKSTTGSPNIWENVNEVSSGVPVATKQFDLNLPSNETMNKITEKNVCIENNQIKTDSATDSDEDTASAISYSLAPSSNVSESSEIQSSSCIDTSDDDMSDDTNLNTSTISFTNIVSESSSLLNENLAQNPCNTKITSLVESLKQRLSKNTSSMDSEFTESVKKPPVKTSVEKENKMSTGQSITNNSTGQHESKSVIPPDTDSVVSMESPKKTLSAGEGTNATSNQSPGSLLPLQSSTSTSEYDLNFNWSLTGSTYTKPEQQIVTQTSCVENSSGILDFKKRFPFITSGHMASDKTKSAKLSSFVHDMHKFPKQSNPLDSFDELNRKLSIEKEVILFNEARQKHPEEKLDVPTSKVPLAIDLNFSSNCTAAEKEIIPSTPLSDLEIDDGSESDVDVGTENAVPGDKNSNFTQNKWLLCSPPLPAGGRNHLKDFTRENEFIMPKTDSNLQGTLTNHKKELKSNVPPKAFTLPIKPQTKTKKSSPKTTPTPSAASLLCQKLDIAVEPIVPKLKGKLVTPLECPASVNIESSNQSGHIASQAAVPKPINSAFRPSINAIFGVSDIPKSLDTVINKPASADLNVARKSSTKNNTSQVKMKRQVAKKGTAGKGRAGILLDQQKSKEASESKKLLETNLKRKPQSNEVIETKRVQETNVKSKCQSKQVIKTKKPRETIAKLKKQSSTVINNKKPQENNSNVKKQGKEVIASNKPLSVNSKLKSMEKKTKSGVKPGVTNRKLGALLVEVNRYSSLRKFAWRKYAKDKTFILETAENDNIPEIVESEFFGETINHDNDSIVNDQKSDGEIMPRVKPFKVKMIKSHTLEGTVSDSNLITNDKHKVNLDAFELKQCKVLLSKLEKEEWGSEAPVKTESGTYLLKPPQEKHPRVSDLNKKKRKKSALKTHKKGKPNRPKKDIVDYYTAALEALRKKALLLEEAEPIKCEKMEEESQTVIKEEVVELLELSDTSFLEVQAQNSDVGEIQFNPSDYCGSYQSSLGSVEIKKDGTFEGEVNQKDAEEHSIEIDSNTSNDNSIVQNSSPLDDQSIAEDNSQATCPENVTYLVKNITRGSEPGFSTEGENGFVSVGSDVSGTKNSSKYNVKIVETNYDGDTIQVLTMHFQDQSDVEMSDDNVDTNVPEEVIGSVSSSRDNTNDGEIHLNNRVATAAIKSLEQGESSLNHEKRTLGENSFNDTGDTRKEVIPKEIVGNLCVNGKGSEQKIIPKETTAETEVMQGIESETKTNVNLKIFSKDDNQKLVEQHATTTETPKVNEAIFDTLTETSLASDSNFVPKDIVLGFENELGAETVLSKMGSEDDDMFLLDDAGDASENIGLLQDEEVERLLGLDGKDDEGDLIKTDDKAIHGTTNPNINKLSWKMLPQRVNAVDDVKVKEPEQTGVVICEAMKQHPGIVALGDTSEELRNVNDAPTAKEINTHEEYESNKHPERSSKNNDNKPGDIAPSWKRILGTQALKEIEQSVSSTIASVSVNKDFDNKQTSEIKLKPTLQTDKFKLKLCTGALSKALKLSAEMRKTFGDNANDSNVKAKGDKAKKNEHSKSQEIKKIQEGKGPSEFINTTKSITPIAAGPINSLSSVKSDSNTIKNINFYGDGMNTSPSLGSCSKETSKNRDDGYENKITTRAGNDIVDEPMNIGVSRVTIVKSTTNLPPVTSNRDICSKVESQATDEIMSNTSTHTGHPDNNVNITTKPLGKKTIDLTKLKMKLTPLLASAKVKSITKDVNISPPNALEPVPLGKEQTTADKEIVLSIEPSVTNAPIKKPIVPLLNTEKLTNILKNFKKPLNLNLQSVHSKVSKDSSHNNSNSPQTDNNSSCSKAQNATEQRPSLRKRPGSLQSMKADQPVKAKKTKLSEREGSKGPEVLPLDITKDAEGERSCFDCLSEITVTGDVWEKK